MAHATIILRIITERQIGDQEMCTIRIVPYNLCFTKGKGTFRGTVKTGLNRGEWANTTPVPTTVDAYPVESALIRSVTIGIIANAPLGCEIHQGEAPCQGERRMKPHQVLRMVSPKTYWR